MTIEDELRERLRKVEALFFAPPPSENATPPAPPPNG
jgi:hypothetical protein